MRISYLREFVTAAKTGNFTKAARLLNMAQPVLSKHIAQVEKEMGCELFDRSSNPAALTQQGKVLLEDIQGVLVAVVADKGLPIAGLSEAFLFEEPLSAVVRKGHRLSGASSVAPADLSGEMVWGSFAAPVARHYLAVKDLLEERGADTQFAEIPFRGSPSALEPSFEKGAYADGSGVVMRSLPSNRGDGTQFREINQICQ